MKIKLIIILTLFRLIGNIATAQDKDGFPLRKFISNDSAFKLLSNFYTNKPEKINPYFLPRKYELAKKVKDEILSILKREWPDSILNIRIEEYFRKDFEYMYLEKIIAKSVERTKDTFYKRYQDIYRKSKSDTNITLAKEYHKIYNSLYKYVYDSMALNFRKEIEQKIRETPIPDEIVFTAGVLQLKEAIPILKKDLESGGKHYFNKEAVEIALAGLGDPVLQAKYIEKHQQIVVSNDRFALWQVFLNMALVIHTQESVSKLADWMDTSKIYLSNGGEGDYYTRALTGKELVPNILWFIKNKSLKEGYMKLPIKEGHSSYYDEYGVTGEQMTFLRNWLIKNKGKYEFD